jgi:hypothetical protein
MRAQSEDTDLQAERVQIDLLRKATIARRSAIALSLRDTMSALARRAIRLQNPHLGDREILVRFVAIHYGQELAGKLDADLKRRLA